MIVEAMLWKPCQSAGARRGAGTRPGPAEERQARQQLAAAKMIANEIRRVRGPEVLMRTMKGRGVPLLTNAHALPDDRKLRGV